MDVFNEYEIYEKLYEEKFGEDFPYRCVAWDYADAIKIIKKCLEEGKPVKVDSETVY